MAEKTARHFFFQPARSRGNDRQNHSIALVVSRRRASVEQAGGTFDREYCEEHRAYHNLSHIRAMLAAAEKFKDKIADYDSVRLAVWFTTPFTSPERKRTRSTAPRWRSALWRS
jgi:predicted metal-dependent HD superfamily phosphohydrolase